MFTNRPTVNVTATKTLTNDDMNKVLRVVSTAAVVLTLPTPPTSGMLSVLIHNCADQNLTVQCPAGYTAIAKNNVAANSVAFSTVALKIGGLIWAYSYGGGWNIINLSTNTETVA